MKEIKEITRKMELACGGDLVQSIASKATFVQEGVISKYSLSSNLIQAMCASGIMKKQTVIEPFEIRFILNQIDKNNS